MEIIETAGHLPEGTYQAYGCKQDEIDLALDRFKKDWFTPCKEVYYNPKTKMLFVKIEEEE